ncbi:MAG: antibiotic biosynthesis monooxygenase [Candidatus Sulfotelmatobacter sp.]
MFARILNFEVKPEKKEDLEKALKNQIVPILKKQNGFLEILPFFPEKMREEKVYAISLWTTRADADRYERDIYPKVYDILKPIVTTAVEVKHYHLETTVCERFAESLVA